MKFRQTKLGIAICPFFIWTSENIEGGGHTENDVNLTLCTHPENKKNEYEGSCQENFCPLRLEYYAGTKNLVEENRILMRENRSLRKANSSFAPNQLKLKAENRKLTEALNECYSTIAALENGNDELRKENSDLKLKLTALSIEINEEIAKLNCVKIKEKGTCVTFIRQDDEENEVLKAEAAGEERQKMIDERFKHGNKLICEACTDIQRRLCRFAKRCPIEDGNPIERKST